MSSSVDAPAGPVSRLRWYPDRGFELDLNAAIGEVTLMLVAVPLPAGGTTQLRDERLELDKLEILFKAQVDVAGAPGQLTEAHVQITTADGRDVVRLETVVEDAETGETHDIKVEAPVDVPREAPESGGPQPRPADEADLDWDDDDTFEAMFKDPLTQEDPLPIAERNRGADDADDEPAAAKKEAGFDRLLKALLAADPITDEAALDGPLTDDTAAGDGAAPLHLVDGAVEPASSAMVADPADAAGLLDFLVEREQLELEEGHAVAELVAGAAPILAAPKGPDARARALSEWLFDQPAVAELYIDDEDLAGLIDQW
jgi:hypothetical protein